jgi:hypothetical protein
VLEARELPGNLDVRSIAAHDVQIQVMNFRIPASPGFPVQMPIDRSVRANGTKISGAQEVETTIQQRESFPDDLVDPLGVVRGQASYPLPEVDVERATCGIVSTQSVGQLPKVKLQGLTEVGPTRMIGREAQSAKPAMSAQETLDYTRRAEFSLVSRQSPPQVQVALDPIQIRARKRRNNRRQASTSALPNTRSSRAGTEVSRGMRTR